MDIDALIRDNWKRGLLAAIRILRNREDAEDAVQRASIKAFQNAAQFRGEAKPSTWFFSIVVHEALMLRRAAIFCGSKTDYLEEMDFVEFPVVAPSPEKMVMEEERFRLLMRFIMELPSPKLREGMRMCLAGEPRGAESTPKARVHRARKVLRERLAEEKLEELACF